MKRNAGTAIALALAAVATPGLVTSSAAAGATGPVVVDGAAQPVYASAPRDWIVKEAWVTVPVDSDRDGRPDRVHVNYARANDAPDRVPVVMAASPYFTGVNEVPNHNVDHDLYYPDTRWAQRTDALARQGNSANGLHDPWTAAYWVPRGFGWVEVESLGTGTSTGCPTTGGTNETLGPKAVIDWLAGRGHAVDARGRTVRPDGFRASVGMVGTSYDGTLPNAVATTGVPELKAIIPISAISDWYDYYRSGGAVVAPQSYQGEDADVLAKFVLTRANRAICAPIIKDLGRRQDRRTGDRNAFWQERNYRARAGRVTAAVYAAHGLSDWNVKPSQAGRWYRALRAGGVPVKIYWHPGGHGGPPPQREQNRWFTHFLMGVANGVEREPRALVETVDGSLERYADWPVPGSRPRTTSLSQWRIPGQPQTVTRLSFRDDTAYTLLGGQLPRRGRGLVFTSAPLTEPTRLSGFARADLRIKLGQPNANVTVGIVELPGGAFSPLVTMGWTDPQNRHGEWRTEPVTPGEWMNVDVDLEASEHVFQAGSRIGIVVIQSDHEFTIRPPMAKTMTLDTRSSTITLPLTRALPR